MFNDSALATLSLKGKVQNATKNLPIIFQLYVNYSTPSTLLLKGKVNKASQHLPNICLFYISVLF